MDLPASPAEMSSFFRYQPIPALGKRPIPPPALWMNGPSIAQSCGKFIFCHELSSKPGCTYATPSPGFPWGRTNLRDGSLMKSFPVGRIHCLITAVGFVDSFVEADSLAAAL